MRANKSLFLASDDCTVCLKSVRLKVGSSPCQPVCLFSGQSINQPINHQLMSLHVTYFTCSLIFFTDAVDFLFTFGIKKQFLLHDHSLSKLHLPFSYIYLSVSHLSHVFFLSIYHPRSRSHTRLASPIFSLPSNCHANRRAAFDALTLSPFIIVFMTVVHFLHTCTDFRHTLCSPKNWL